MKLETGESYVVKEEFVTPVLNGHEIGGSWEGGRSVRLDPGNTFTVESGPDKSGWLVAEMDHALWFESQENPGGSISWKGKFYLRDSMKKYVMQPEKENK